MLFGARDIGDLFLPTVAGVFNTGVVGVDTVQELAVDTVQELAARQASTARAQQIAGVSLPMGVNFFALSWRTCTVSGDAATVGGVSDWTHYFQDPLGLVST
jgi:hypothetical protein